MTFDLNFPKNFDVVLRGRHLCLFRDVTFNTVLSASVQTYSHEFFQQRTHDGSDNKADPEQKKGQLSSCAVIMLKREREHSGFPKPSR